ncbi:polymorphic toxin-type HINT domain-containing protein [Streptomyces sp. SCSIO 30461]|uniref:polymorphic toxin-type HINT domain-containing protein n=1 Tax=Streptomyces sp. SCSIO 30461 TaxID=3118085 RepID=UPI0030CB1064
MVGLMPSQALAIPPDPSREGREELVLEKLDQDEPVSGTTVNKSLDSLKTETPEDLVQAPAGTTTVPPADIGKVSFGSAVTPASARTAGTSGAVQTGMKQVEDLPVSLGQADGEAAPQGEWAATVVARTAGAAEGVDGAVFTVQAPSTGSVPLSVRFDYAKFKNLYGADWASRLRIVQFPECYLTTPDEEACQAYEELETVNDTADGTVTATVDTAADGTVTPAVAPSADRTGGPAVVQAAYRTQVAAVAGGDKAVLGVTDSGAGEGGSFKATPLAFSGSWAAGGSSGAFTWSYPLAVPPAPAGPSPNVSFEYNSQTVDGKTAVSSPQASWIGEGWDYDPGRIERRYRTCKDDTRTLRAGTPNNTAAKDKTSDLCWVSHNAVMTLNGRTTELVRVGDTDVYRPQNDDGTRVQLRTGATNGDNDGEHWVVTTTDGTVYYYGLNAVGGGHANTDSVSTVPVFGNHPGEPCHAATFAESRCGTGKQQAWQWGLDKVVDVHGNAMVIDWHQSVNYYAVRNKLRTPEAYDRAAYPDSIEYGMRSSDLTKPSARVDLVAAQRCLESATSCEGGNFDKTDDPGAYRLWWDSPGNLNCKSTSKFCPSFPSFWTRLRLSSVTTYAQRSTTSGLQKVDTYTLHQSFPKDWYDTAPSLWLDSITRTGYSPGATTGTLQSKDGVSFGPYTVGTRSPLSKRLRDRQLPSLVPSGSGDKTPGFTRPRIGTVATENGADIEVEYTGGCSAEPDTDEGRSNGTCYPVRWSPDGEEKTPAKAWFNKYVVAFVAETDKVTTHGLPIVTTYKYTGPAWARSDDEFIRPSLRTYSRWRGYREVKTFRGSERSGTANTRSYTRTRYFQGTGGPVKDSGNAVELVADDAEQFAGMTAETLTYEHSRGQVVKRALTFPKSKQTASRTREAEDGTDLDPLLAHRTWVGHTDAIQTVGSSWQTVRTQTTGVDDTYGLPTEVEMSVVKPNGTSGETLSNQVCTRTSYVHNTSSWIIGRQKEARATATPCSGFDAANPATQLLSSVRTSYDGQSWGAAPTKGLPTSSAEINGTGTSHSVVTTTTYDPLGRVRKVTAPERGTSETVYTPGDTGGPVTSVTTINPMGHSSTTTYDPGRGLPLTATDTNGRVTRSEYDALGRLVKGWSPARSSGGKSPSVEFSYRTALVTDEDTTPASVTVKSLKDDGTYSRQVTIYDGLGREVQTQAEAHGAGRVIVDTKYDERGLLQEKTGGYLARNSPSTELFARKSESLVPSKTRTEYDGLGRVVKTSVFHGKVYQRASTVEYGDTTVLSDPAGATAPTTKTYTDALGRVTSIRHYTAGTSEWRTTSYEYDARGDRTKVTDPAGNTWTYTYDTRGRLKESTDPDTGTASITYDNADRKISTTDAREKTTYTAYDALDRITAVREGSATATPVKEFTYDSLIGAVGQPASAIRHTSGGDYISRVTGYDTEYRVTGRETVVPSNATTAGLSGTYKYLYTYTPTGKPLSVTLPAKGGLAAEKVVTRYDAEGLPESTSGLDWYTSDVTYSPYGEVLRTVSGPQPYRVWTTNFVNQHSGRLQRTVTDRETANTHRISDSYYSYDASGTITSNARKLTDSTGSTWDNQCFTYDALGELVHAWTSDITPGGSGTGCRSSGGDTWGYRSDGVSSSGPVANAPNTAGDTTSPDSALTDSLKDAAPESGTVSTGTTAYRQAFTFDWLGNRAGLTEHNTADATKNVSFTYGYGTTGAVKQPHTLTSVTSTAAGQGSTYTNDAVGNTQTRKLSTSATSTTSQSLDWTAENKLNTITSNGVKTSYVYDAAGDRILENSTSGSTLYLGETELTTDSTGKIIRASRAYGHAGAPTVVRTTTNGSYSGHKLNVLIADHLGTANTTVEIGSTQTVTRRAFKPYGEARGPKPSSWPNKRSYLGVGIDDSTTGLTHIGAREYDQAAGRFLSADPLIDIADPLQMNGYAYSHNSPISRSDPTGLYDPDLREYERQQAAKKKKEGDSGGDNPAPPGTTATTYTITKTVTVTKPAPCDWWCKTKGWMQEHATAITIVTEIVVGVACGAAAVAAGAATAGVGAVAVGAACGAIAGAVAGAVGNALDPNADHSLGGYASAVGTGAAVGAAGSIVGGAVFKAATTGAKAIAKAVAGKTATSAAAGGAKSGVSAATKPQCFLAGTAVLMADGTKKNIEDIKVGDDVLATDPETGQTGARPVTALISTKGVKKLHELSIKTSAATKKITATAEHPFWIPAKRAWVKAGELKPGMMLATADGSRAKVTENRAYTKLVRTYNFTVADLHTYYVLAGTTPVLVHNTCGEIDYGSIGADGRRSGIVAEVTPDMLGTGGKASRSMDPPGFVSGANGDARGHLLPKALGGSGNTPENFVRTTAAIDNGPMNEFEKEIAEYVSKGNVIMYSATPHYRLGGNVPFAVSIEAFDDTGWYMGRTFMQ